MWVTEKRVNSECKKYRYIGGHKINDEKLTVGETYFIRENYWGIPCIIGIDNKAEWILSKLALATLFEEVK